MRKKFSLQNKKKILLKFCYDVETITHIRNKLKKSEQKIKRANLNNVHIKGEVESDLLCNSNFYASTTIYYYEKKS